mgnify:CR=1 FL=1
MKKHYTVSAAIIVENKKILCVQRNKGKYDYISYKYEFPGGKLEDNETPIDGAVREFYEETNLKVNSPLNLCGMLKRYTRDGKNVKGLMYTFLMEVDEEMTPDLENAYDGSEHTECGYFSYDELPKPI